MATWDEKNKTRKVKIEKFANLNLKLPNQSSSRPGPEKLVDSFFSAFLDLILFLNSSKMVFN